MIIETNSASETLALGEKLGKAAKPGQIYTLNGDLGVGKTVLTQGFAKGLGITEAVNSAQIITPFGDCFTGWSIAHHY